MKIKETKELFVASVEAVKLAKSVRDIVKDGVGVDDLPKAFEVVKEQSAKFEVYSAALKDIGLVKEELMDLDKNEIVELVMIIVSGVSEVEQA